MLLWLVIGLIQLVWIVGICGGFGFMVAWVGVLVLGFWVASLW